MKCDWCGEEIEKRKRANIQGSNLHGSCAVRTVIGSVGHLMAAMLANLLWRMQSKWRKGEVPVAHYASGGPCRKEKLNGP